MEENKKSYFGEIGAAVKTLAVGMKTTWKEYFTPKSTEQYPENRKPKTLKHLSRKKAWATTLTVHRKQLTALQTAV